MKHYKFTALAVVLALGAIPQAFAQTDASTENSSVWSQVQNGQTVTGEGTEASADAGHVFGTDDVWHPLVNQVDQRDLDQQNRIDAGLKDGQLTQAQFNADQAKLTRQESIQDAQEASNGGHLTFAQSMRDNESLNKTNVKIFKQRTEPRTK